MSTIRQIEELIPNNPIRLDGMGFPCICAADSIVPVVDAMWTRVREISRKYGPSDSSKIVWASGVLAYEYMYTSLKKFADYLYPNGKVAAAETLSQKAELIAVKVREFRDMSIATPEDHEKWSVFTGKYSTFWYELGLSWDAMNHADNLSGDDLVPL